MLANHLQHPRFDERWEAVKRRDGNADSTFVYAVLTTGVYCRPSCAARRPNIENVRFFESAVEAETQGFRPCKRCKPSGASQAEERATAMAQACRMIEEADGTPDFSDIAASLGYSRYHFQRVFRDTMGMTPGAYLKAWRARKAVAAIAEGASVTSAIYEAGYGSSSRFYEAVSPGLGLKPSALARGGQGARIRFAVGQCWLGSILVAATDSGICAIQFGDEPDTLVRDLQDRFPKAQLIGGDADFERMVAQVVGFVEAPHRSLTLPLDISGTSFQLKVWDALRRIPAGETATYSEIAARIGQPEATRAVANACARNAIAVAIPCHRVVRTDRSLSGYRWGAERKAALLNRERAKLKAGEASGGPLPENGRP